MFLQKPGAWFWMLISASVLIRLFLVVFTGGTYDVPIWQSHAQGILDHGLVGQYRASEMLNHPPLAGIVAAALLSVSRSTGLPFAIVMRAPLALIDLGTAFLLGFLFRKSKWRWVATAGYALHPLAIILSAYHGNTDCIIAFFLCLTLIFASEERPVYAAAALGLSIWIKLPGLMAAPALTLSFKTWRQRFTFGVVAVATGVLTFIPVLIIDASILYARVFNYPGQIIQTTAGIRVWGLQNFFYLTPAPLQSAVIWFFLNHRLVVFVSLVVYAWLRRGKQSSKELGLTLAASYSMVYALSNFWSFQYFAWSIPFWFMAGGLFLVGATLLAGGYIYALYAFDCGNLLLRGTWDFIGHPFWPDYLRLLRDGAVLFFFIASIVFLLQSFGDRQRRPTGSG